jgi:hypothetical protein
LLAPLAVKKASLLLSRRRLALYTDAHFAALEQVFGLDRQPQAEFSEADNGQ